ncbi:PAS domain-containing hybrid sensor histidine kinase/response regulator [uncultured Ferrimonas sp.]|uniref:hybrid sensor histidine kinase/response regulator n=1 Tax=uncultured Ferrimonas sp. TaxID=432640 RepID=UPI0026058F48|nr:PAS domain-containing hybrid sensor histidine kinase/response regulator [uncultured Ferrimonas sp.]
MFANWLLVLVSVGYIGLLFLIAFLGDRLRHRLTPTHQRWIYALSLGVYCTSWGFLGTAAQAARGDFSYIPVYLAPILMFLFGWRVIQRIIAVCLRLNITSIADLLAARFGKSQPLAVLVTVVTLIGTLPYLALQLKAIVGSYEVLRQTPSLDQWQLGLLVSVVLTGFTIIFGVRAIDVTERHPGVMVAIAFESLIKLLAFLLVGLFVSFVAFDSPQQIWQLATTAEAQLFRQNQHDLLSLVGLGLIVFSAFLCLPRQFQVTMVELRDQRHSGLSRTLFPIYILVFALLAAPLGQAGLLLYGDTLPADFYVLFLPAAHGHAWLSLLSFLGAISAASAMVIISTIALSTMLSNEVVFPALFHSSDLDNTQFEQFRNRLLLVRKALVIGVMALSFSLYQVAPPDALASLGEVAFGAIAQIGPPLWAAFYWRRVSLAGVFSGILVGFSLWLVLNFLPQLGLYPHPFNDSPYSKTTIATLFGLSVNMLMILMVSRLTRPTVQSNMQREHFLGPQQLTSFEQISHQHFEPQELEQLAARFVGADKASQAFTTFTRQHRASTNKQRQQALLPFSENLLATVMGSASARLVISCAIQGRDIALDEMAQLVTEASHQRTVYSHSVLQSAIENANEGISVIDSNLALVAWNRGYQKLFNYPLQLLQIGTPVRQLIEHNLREQISDPAELRFQVEKRVELLKQGSRHSTERQQPDGTVVKIEGNPIPDGGFVMLFTDITVYRQAEQLLQEKNLDLESRVSERTRKLETANRQLAQSNAELAQAHALAQRAHQQKSQYLKACSHDLLQPLSAARLFSSSLLADKQLGSKQRKQLAQIDQSLAVANELLADLNQIARIDSGTVQPKQDKFPLQPLLQSLADEFSASCDANQIELHTVATRMWVKSDQALLRRVLQNLLSNAFRYARGSKVLLGCRRGEQLEIQVIDTGPGIPPAQQQKVFEQFTRLESAAAQAPTGLGLGLNIAQGLSHLMGHTLTLRSQPGHGCCFSLALEVAPSQTQAPVAPPQRNSLSGVRVLCVDNEPDVLAGMTALLERWHCHITTFSEGADAIAKVQHSPDEFDIMLVDHQLNHGDNGLHLMAQLQQLSHCELPGILITANTDPTLHQQAKQAGFGYLPKLIKPLALRSLMSAMLVQRLQQNYGHTERSHSDPHTDEIIDVG